MFFYFWPISNWVRDLKEDLALFAVLLISLLWWQKSRITKSFIAGGEFARLHECVPVCVCFAVFVPSLCSLSVSLSCEPFVKPEMSLSGLSLQARLQTTLRKLQDVKFAISLGGRLSEHMFD